MKKKKNILYIISGETGFKETDEKILKSFANVIKVNYQSIIDYLNPKTLYYMTWADAILIWFASIHAIPAILLNYFFNKGLFIIANGWDLADVPEIGYGAMRGGSRKIIGKWILSRATKVIADSKSNRNEILNNAKVHPNRIQLIYIAVPNDEFDSVQEKINQVLTVGEINEETFFRKGIDRFINVAKKLPDVQFYHIGKWTDKSGNPCEKTIDYAKKNSPSNIQFLGYQNKKELLRYYRESKIYLQLSRHETFGVSVVEAMASGCIPVVSNQYALPEIVGKNGYITDSNIDSTVNIIREILKSKFEDNNPNILNKDFSIDVRTNLFKELLIN